MSENIISGCSVQVYEFNRKILIYSGQRMSCLDI